MTTIGNIKTADSVLNGLVLAGGYSTRMGTDKSLLVYNGMPQREFLFDLLKKYCDDAFVSCRKEQQVPAAFNPLFDRSDLPGPLNGILTAFQHMSSSWLAVAVDMPFVDDRAIATLLLHRDKTKMATCYFNRDTQQPEPLLTIQEKLQETASAIEIGQWQQLTDLQRFALLKLSYPGHENKNFPKALAEFGIGVG